MDPAGSSLVQLADSISIGRLSLSQAKSTLKENEERIAGWMAEWRKLGQDILRDRASDVEFRHAYLELVVEVALAADSAGDFLNAGLNLGRLLASELGQVRRGVELMEQSLQQLYVVQLDPGEQAKVVLEVADAYLTYHDLLGADYLAVAIQAYKIARRLAEQTDDVLLHARADIGLGTALTETEESLASHADEAIGCYTRGLRFLDPAASPQLYGLAKNNLGNVYSQRPTGNRAENLRHAARYLQDALEVRTEQANLRGFRITCRNLSRVCSELGQHHLAIEYQRRVVASLDPIYERQAYGQAQTELGKRYGTAASYAAGRSYLDCEHYVAQALACYTVARETFDREKDPDAWATATDGLAGIWLNQRGDPEKSIALLEQALAAVDAPPYRSRFNLIGADLVQTCCVYAEGAHTQQDRVTAAQYVDRAREIGKRLADDGSLAGGRLQFLKARVLVTDATLNADAPSALDLLRQAESLVRTAIAESTSATGSAELAMYQRLLTEILIGQSRFTEARQLLDQALARGEELLPDSPSLVDLIGASVNQQRWDSCVHACLAADEIEAALCYADNARARVLGRIVRAEKQAPEGELPSELQERYARLSREWLDLKPQAETDPDADWQLHHLGMQLTEAVEEAWRWRGHWAVEARPFTWSIECNDELLFTDRRTAIIEYWCDTDRAVAFVLLPDDLRQVVAIPLPDGHGRNLLQWGDAWFTHYGRFESEGPIALAAWAGLMERICRELGTAYWTPLLDLLTRHAIERVVVIPDGWMSGLPIHIGRIDAGAQPEYACDRFEISFAPSLSLLRWARQRDGPVRGPILCFGDPIEACPVHLCRGPCTLHLSLAAEQVDAIEALWPDVHCLLGGECSEDNILRAAQEIGPGMIHVVTHGTTLFEDPLGSGLLVRLDQARVANPLSRYLDHSLRVCWADGAVGNILTLDTIVRDMRLEQCRLAVLSACEVGLNQIHVPRENLSVAAGFFAAGVSSVIAPLWPVTEAVAKLITEKLYARLREDPARKALALSEAQKWVRDLAYEEARSLVPQEDLEAAIYLSGQAFPFSSPILWAPFQLLGSPL